MLFSTGSSVWVVSSPLPVVSTGPGSTLADAGLGWRQGRSSISVLLCDSRFLVNEMVQVEELMDVPFFIH